MLEMNDVSLEVFDYRGSNVAKIPCSLLDQCENRCTRGGAALIRLSEITRAQEDGSLSRIRRALTHNDALCQQEASRQAEILIGIDVENLRLLG